jgi:hypothetical protein
MALTVAIICAVFLLEWQRVFEMQKLRCRNQDSLKSVVRNVQRSEVFCIAQAIVNCGVDIPTGHCIPDAKQHELTLWICRNRLWTSLDQIAMRDRA